MRKNTITTIAASALAALSIGLAAPAIAAPSGPGDTSGSNGTSTTVQDGNKSVPTTKSNAWLGYAGETQYGTYQNAHSHHWGMEG
jgi:hypothetical protein